MEVQFHGQRHPSPEVACKEFGFCNENRNLADWMRRWEWKHSWVDDYEWMHEKWHEALDSLAEIVRSDSFLSNVHVVVCGGPAWFCSMLRAVKAIPMLLYFAWPLVPYIPASLRSQFLLQIQTLGQATSPPAILVAANWVLAVQFALQEPEEQEEEAEEDAQSDLESANGDDDRDFDDGDDTAQKPLPGLMVASGTKLRCNWVDPEKEDDFLQSWKRVKVDPVELEDSEKAALAQLLLASKACERLQLRGPQHPLQKCPAVPQRHESILRAVSESLMGRLVVLRVDNFPGSGDPVFGTKHELRRSFRAPDLFGKLAEAFQGASGTRSPSLKKVTLQGGYHSASSVCRFLQVVKPELESFRCRDCLFHGRNFEMLVRALSGTSQKSLMEFETDAAIGGQDPFGLLADSFPNLKMLRVKYMFGKTGPLEALKRLKQLRKKQCVLPRESHRLCGRPAVDEETGIVYWFITSERHDDNYSGEGLSWDELWNTCECMEEWAVGKGVTKEQCLAFMEDCGIGLDDELDDEHCGLDVGGSAVDSETDEDTIVAQLEIDESVGSEGALAIKARTMDGREFAQMTLDAKKTSVRTLIDDLASKYPCSPLSLRLVLPGGGCIDVLETANQVLAAVLV
ncbi:ANKRD17 [Symbiodinium microadriaticum]|nr:ANKRD17 [Symbiodinium microadriaticum]